ncbi:MAG: DUF350 domain-containing protein [Cyclobacteriaceae bacterium]|nr:DUF350 domain-containing protein [Cyclobacteriaceae bacterium]
MQYLDGLLATLVYLAASFVLFLLGKFAYKIFNPGTKVSWELVENDNLAFALSYVGYFTGLLLAIGSAVMGDSGGLLYDMMDIGVYGVLAILLLNLSMKINDKLILRKFSTKKEILQDKNAGTGVVEGANAVATGLIILGAISGEGAGFGGPIVTAILYWVIGQAVLFITSLIYNAITPYDIHEHIEKDNVAVGIGFAGAMIAIANLIRFALMHDFESWIITLEDVGIDVSIGLIMLPLVRIFADKILLPGRNLTDELINQEKPNIGAALIEAFAYVGGSVLITWAL